MLKENVEKILDEIRGGNDRGEEITLVAATKTVPAETINEAISYGVGVVAENRVQEFREKTELIVGAKQHFIGHLQTNKVKHIIGKTVLIHSLDSLQLAAEIQKHSENAGVITNCLVQVNSTGIEDRFGVPYDSLSSFIDEVEKNMPNIRLCGMMGMAPKDENPTPYFEKLHEAFLNSKLSGGILSMGMSADFKEALACGSTMVRIGRIIFE